MATLKGCAYNRNHYCGASYSHAALRSLCDRYGLWLRVDGTMASRLSSAPSIDGSSSPSPWPTRCMMRTSGSMSRSMPGRCSSASKDEWGARLASCPPTSTLTARPMGSSTALVRRLWFTAISKLPGHDGLDEPQVSRPLRYAEAITHDIALAEHLARLVDASADVERLATGLSIVCFRYAPPQLRGDAARLDALNKTLLETLQRRTQPFLLAAPRWWHFVLRA